MIKYFSVLCDIELFFRPFKLCLLHFFSIFSLWKISNMKVLMFRLWHKQKFSVRPKKQRYMTLNFDLPSPLHWQFRCRVGKKSKDINYCKTHLKNYSFLKKKIIALMHFNWVIKNFSFISIFTTRQNRKLHSKKYSAPSIWCL